MDVLKPLASFILGLILGSFLNVCAYRLPREESIVRPRSRCPNCKVPIRWYDNIPVLSFVFLRGKCRFCKAPISWRYPVVELLTGFMALGLFIRYGFNPVYFYLLAFGAALVVTSLIDLEFQIIPDEISLPGILVGLAGSFWNPLVTPLSSLLGALVGAGSLYLVAEYYYFITKREGMGGGDLKLLAMIGSFLGVSSLLPVIFMASLVGAVAGLILAFWQKVHDKRHLALPFGPFLALGALIILFYPQVVDLFFGIWFAK